jgi:hypothetical protein
MKTRLLLVVVAALVAAVGIPAIAGAQDPWTGFAFRGSPYVGSTYGYYPYGPGYTGYAGDSLRSAQRGYWDDDLVDSVGKIVTLPFTLPARVKGEWKRLDAKASHWGKAGEAYKAIPPEAASPSRRAEAELQKELMRLQGELLRLQKELADRSPTPSAPAEP